MSLDLFKKLRHSFICSLFMICLWMVLDFILYDVKETSFYIRLFLFGTAAAYCALVWTSKDGCLYDKSD